VLQALNPKPSPLNPSTDPARVKRARHQTRRVDESRYRGGRGVPEFLFSLFRVSGLGFRVDESRYRGGRGVPEFLFSLFRVSGLGFGICLWISHFPRRRRKP
jgi:hypothetical protein